jgi:hypothetical protein
MIHLNGLQIAANESSSDSRSVMTGYKLSADYIKSTLAANAKCKVSEQEFQTAIATELEPPILTIVAPVHVDLQIYVDYRGMRYGGNSTVNITKPVCVIRNVGCNADDFNNTEDQCVALIRTSSQCSLIQQAMNAQEANCSAIIFYNPSVSSTTLPSARVRGAGWFPGDPLVQIPVLSCSYSIGNLLTALVSPVVELYANTSIVITSTFNIFCETEGDNNTVIVAGAHLDSVPEGPGLNDNGSGSSSLLEIVLQWYARGLTPVNKIIFAWWGSEEVGLIGSRHYVNSLSDTSFRAIAMNLNFDMLASPNYVLGIHDGSTAVLKQNESLVITSMFIEYFDSMQLPYSLAELRSGSDFVPFIEAGIPAGGLVAGASSIKTDEERTIFGGFANTQKDPCYHLPCDTIENINQQCLGYMASAAAYVIQKSAQMNNLREYLETTPVQKSYAQKSQIYDYSDL